MAIQVMCTRGCGVPITIGDELLELARAGQPLDVSHEVCPGGDRSNEYRVQIVVERITHTDSGAKVTELARNGATVEARSFAEGFANLSKELGRQWTRVEQMKNIVEMEDTPPQRDKPDSGLIVP